MRPACVLRDDGVEEKVGPTRPSTPGLHLRGRRLLPSREDSARRPALRPSCDPKRAALLERARARLPEARTRTSHRRLSPGTRAAPLPLARALPRRPVAPVPRSATRVATELALAAARLQIVLHLPLARLALHREVGERLGEIGDARADAAGDPADELAHRARAHPERSLHRVAPPLGERLVLGLVLIQHRVVGLRVVGRAGFKEDSG